MVRVSTQVSQQTPTNDVLLNKANLLLRQCYFRRKRGARGTIEATQVAPTVTSLAFCFCRKATESLAEYTEGAKYRYPSARDIKVVASDYVVLSDFTDADKWFTKVVEWTPEDVQAWYDLGRTKYNENRFDEAISAFHKTLQLDPTNVKAEDNLGLSLGATGRNDEAIAAYKRATASGTGCQQELSPYR